MTILPTLIQSVAHPPRDGQQPAGEAQSSRRTPLAAPLFTRPAVSGGSGGEPGIPSDDAEGAKMDGGARRDPGRAPQGEQSNLQSSRAATFPHPHEKWADVPGYEGIYTVSDCGRVANQYGKLIKPFITKSGYFIVALHNNKRKKNFKVHRLVAVAFLAEWDASLTVNHKDFNKGNNHVSNLEMCSQADNINHYRTGVKSGVYGETHDSFTNRGELSHFASLTERQVKEIISLFSLPVRPSDRDIAAHYRVANNTIGRIRRGKAWTHLPRPQEYGRLFRRRPGNSAMSAVTRVPPPLFNDPCLSAQMAMGIS